MTISEQIKMLCARLNISSAELARRLGQSPQNFSGKLQRESFTVREIDEIAKATGTSFTRKFLLPNGEEI